VPRLAKDRNLRVRLDAVKLPRPTGIAKLLAGAAEPLQRALYPLAYEVTIESDDGTATVLFNVRSGLAGFGVGSIELWPASGQPRAEDVRYPHDAYMQVIEHALAITVYGSAEYEYRIADGVILGPDGADIRAPKTANGKPRERRRPQPLSEKDLRAIAAVYRGNPRRPKKAVAEARGVSERTAARQIDQARNAGFLGAALRNRPGEARQ
jgi:hypothetical protein